MTTEIYFDQLEKAMNGISEKLDSPECNQFAGMMFNFYRTLRKMSKKYGDIVSEYDCYMVFILDPKEKVILKTSILKNGFLNL